MHQRNTLTTASTLSTYHKAAQHPSALLGMGTYLSTNLFKDVAKYNNAIVRFMYKKRLTFELKIIRQQEALK